jgi:hypothetical protein
MYNFENIEFEDGIFDHCVDATYIIHVENDGRLESVRNQLLQYHPSNKVHLLFNKGPIESGNIPPVDLVQAFFHCFEHASENAYRNILILEDDFTFSEQISDSKNISNICQFIKKKDGEPTMYRLGCIPVFQMPCTWDFMHYKGVFMGTHGVIYNKAYCDKLLEMDKNTIIDWDIFNNGVFKANCYTYYMPLCYQLFPETKNSFYWGIENPIYCLFGSVLFFIYQLFGLNVSIEPGYSFFYSFSKFLFFIIFAIFFCIFIYFSKVYKNFIDKSKKYYFDFSK